MHSIEMEARRGRKKILLRDGKSEEFKVLVPEQLP